MLDGNYRVLMQHVISGSLDDAASRTQDAVDAMADYVLRADVPADRLGTITAEAKAAIDTLHRLAQTIRSTPLPTE